MFGWFSRKFSRKLTFGFCLLTLLSSASTALFLSHVLHGSFTTGVNRSMVFFIIGISSLAILMGLIMSRSFSRPVKEMSEVIAGLTRGYYEARVKQTRLDEHGRLGEILNLLASHIQGKIHELSHDKSQLISVLENMTDAVVAVDTSGKTTVANPAFSILFGVDPLDSKNRLFLEVMRHSQLNQLVQSVLQDQNSRVEEVQTFSPDELVFEAHAVPLKNELGFAGALLVLHDITQLRRLEQVRRDFVANISHELRTPLASIRGFAETLMGGGVDDKTHRREFLQSIEKHANQMTELVEDLLDLTAIESGRRIPMKESVTLHALISDVINSFRPLAQRKKVDLMNQIPLDFPPINADAGQLRQVFTNLIDNAIKFNKENGHVHIKAEQERKNVTVAVEDSGIGIPNQDVPRIFERFYRVDKARSRAMGGTGLGLSIVKHIVESHGGSISVASSVGKGSIFAVTLPLA